MDSKLEKHLHIIHPGISGRTGEHYTAEVFNKIAAMWQEGVKIHLHTFDQLKTHHDQLSIHCEEIHYYSPVSGHQAFSLKLPVMVTSHRSSTLIKNLMKDSHPILLEGISSTYIVTDERFQDRKILLNLHEAASEAGSSLFSEKSSIIRKMLWSFERFLLKKYKQRLIEKVTVISSSPIFSHSGTDPLAWQAVYMPAFTGYQKVQTLSGNGCYCLYYGDFTLQSNEDAALHLLHEVFYHIKLPCVIAGNNPSMRLKRAAKEHPHTCIVENPDEKSLADMISKAQLHLLPSMDDGDTELKLLNILFNGRHCIVTSNINIDQKILAHCNVANSVDELKQIIQQLYSRPFTDQMVEQRKVLLESQYDHKKNVAAIFTLLS